MTSEKSYKILIYSPMQEGHFQVSCNILIDVLLGLGLEVVLVAGLLKEAHLWEFQDVFLFEKDDRVQIIDGRKHIINDNGIPTIEELISIQQLYNVDITIFPEASRLQSELLRIGIGKAPRLLGRNIGIFEATYHWYPGENSYTGQRRPRYGSPLKKQISSIKQRLIRGTESEDYFYDVILKKKHILDAILVKDERVVRDIGRPFTWFPEIYEPYYSVESIEDTQEFKEVSEEYECFLENQKGREILLYFGTAASYKGYDYLLRLATLDDSACFVHCGKLSWHKEVYTFDINALRQQLNREGRLFETKRFIHSKQLIDRFYGSTNRIVLNHRQVGTSATMLQALSAGKPVLVPDAGLVGYRVRTNNLGMTYQYGDIEDLLQQWRIFKQIPEHSYLPSIKTFMGKFDRASHLECIRKALGISGI